MQRSTEMCYEYPGIQTGYFIIYCQKLYITAIILAFLSLVSYNYIHYTLK